MSVKILALDLGSRLTGWSTVTEGGRFYHGTLRLPECDHKDAGPIMAKYRDFLNDQFAALGREDLYVVYEAQYVGDKMQAYNAVRLFGMTAVTQMACRDAGIVTYFEANLAKVRKFYLGTTRGGRAALKRMAIEQAFARGYDVGEREDEADALAVAHWAYNELYQMGKISTPIFEGQQIRFDLIKGAKNGPTDGRRPSPRDS